MIVLVAFKLFSCAGESSNEDASYLTIESDKTSNDISEETLTELEEPNTDLTSEQLEAFELRAIQKFYDFTDFVKMISNNQIDKDLREHSIQLSTDLFINDSVLITDSSLIDKSESSVTLANFLNRIKPRSTPISVKTTSIEFAQNLTKDTNNIYTGSMYAIVLVNGKTKKINIVVELVEIQKEFGNNSQTITDVRLGNIY